MSGQGSGDCVHRSGQNSKRRLSHKRRSRTPGNGVGLHRDRARECAPVSVARAEGGRISEPEGFQREHRRIDQRRQLWSKTMDGRIVGWNRALENLTGRSRDETSATDRRDHPDCSSSSGSENGHLYKQHWNGLTVNFSATSLVDKWGQHSRNADHHRQHHGSRPAGRPADSEREAYVDRVAGGGRCPRSEHATSRDFQLLANAAKGNQPRGFAIQAAGEDHQANIPRFRDRQ